MSFGCVQAWMTGTGREVLLHCYVQISGRETRCKTFNCIRVVDCIKIEEEKQLMQTPINAGEKSQCKNIIHSHC